jgi:hypothetical protein
MMREMSSTAWLRRGSSIVFDKQSLGPLISDGSLVSLHQALEWIKTWPTNPPSGTRTVLVSGLEAFLEVLSSGEAESFLRGRIKPFILAMQEHWDQVGLVFGFGTSAHSFAVTNMEEEIVFLRRGGERVRLSQFMWDGSSMLNLTRLVRAADQQANPMMIGYYVPRIS